MTWKGKMLRLTNISIKNKGLLFFFLAVFNTAHAQSFVQTEDFFDLSFEQLLDVQIESATKTLTDIADVPAPITSFSRAEISALGVRYLHELLEYVPGYQLSRYATYQQQYVAASRSLTDGASSKKLLFLLDGRPINDPRTGGDVNLFNFSVEHIERLEVIRGPGSSIYGSNAFTGVINIIPRKAGKQVKIQTGNEINHDVFLQWHHSWQQVDAQIQVNTINSKGDKYQLPDTFSEQLIHTRDPFEQHSVLINVTSERTKFTLQHRYLSSDEFYSVQRVSNTYNTSVHKLWTASLEQDFDIWSDTKTKVSLDYINSGIESGNQSTAPGAFSGVSTPDSDEPLYGVGLLDATRIQLDIFNDLKISANQSLQYGITWHVNDETRAEGFTNFDIGDLLTQNFPIRHYPNLDSPVAIGPEDSQEASSALFQYQHRHGDWFWIVGGRYDDYEDIGSRFTPRLGTQYAVDDNWQVKLLYGEAFRAPDLSETGLVNGVTRTGNRNLDYETIKTYDLITQYTDNKLIASLNLYFNEFSAPIIAGTIDGQQSYINGKDTNSYGLESEIKYSLSEQTWLRVAMTQVFDMPNASQRQSRSLLNLHINHKLNDVQFGFSGIYRSERQTLVSETEYSKLKSYWFWRGQIKYQYSSRWQFALLVNNLEGTQHIGPAAGFTLPGGVPHPGRQISISTEYSF